MSKTDELKFNTLPQEIEEDTNEENEHNKEQEKDSLKELEKENLKENDDFNTAGFEVIELHSDIVKSNFFKKLRKYYTLIGILVFLVLCLLVTTFFLFHGFNKDEDNTLNYNLERRRNDIEEANKKLNNKKSEPHKNNPPKKKITVGFLYPSVTQFMISTGEYFVQNGKMNVLFMTKAPGKNELFFNKNIKRVQAYYNHKEIQKTVKNEKIDFLIVNDALSKVETDWLKSLGIKLIGVLDNIYMSNLSKNPKKDGSIYKKLEAYDAYIQEAVEDYNTYVKKLNLKKNIFIPNIYTFDKKQKKNPFPLPSNNKIIAFGDLYDKKGGIYSLINTMPLILKEFPKTNLTIVSQNTATKEINELLTKLKLTKNVRIHPLNENSSELFYDSSVFVSGSLTEVCPLALSEARANSLPSIISSKIPDNPLIAEGTGVVKINITNYNLLSKEIIQIFKDNKYRNKLGKEAKNSLDNYNINNAKLWERLFYSLMAGDKDFQKLRYEIEGLFTKKEVQKPDAKVVTKKELTKTPAKPEKNASPKTLPKTETKKEVVKTPAKTETKKEVSKKETKKEKTKTPSKDEIKKKGSKKKDNKELKKQKKNKL